MASTSGTSTSSGSGGSYPGFESDLQQLMDQRKRKRIISNRESARRSRMKKQKRLDDLTSQLSQLSEENRQIVTGVSITTQHYVSLEAQNSVLRAQVAELGNRLQSLNEIIAVMSQPMELEYGRGCTEFVDELMNDSLSYVYVNQPILASANMTEYHGQSIY